MRILYHLPIIHEPSDMPGGAGEPIGDPTITSAYWDMLEERLWDLKLPWRSTLLYQDGLGAGTKTWRMVAVGTMADRGSRNALLLYDLIMQGARLLPTEDWSAVRAHLAFRQQTPRNTPGFHEQNEGFMARRDAAIAAHVRRTLRPDHIGLLFLGNVHRDVRGFLDSDIVVREVVPQHEAVWWMFAALGEKELLRNVEFTNR